MSKQRFSAVKDYLKMKAKVKSLRLFKSAVKVAKTQHIQDAFMVRLQSNIVKKGQFGSVIEFRPNFTPAMPVFPEDGGTPYYVFTENRSVNLKPDEIATGVKSFGIIGTNCAIIKFLLQYKDRLIVNKIENLQDIYIGYGKFDSSDNFKGLFPMEDFLTQLVNNLNGILSAGFASSSEISALFEGQNLDFINDSSSAIDYLSKETNAKEITKDVCEAVSVANDYYQSGKLNGIENQMNNIVSRDKSKKLKLQMLVISYLKDNDNVPKELVYAGTSKLSFESILLKLIKISADKSKDIMKLDVQNIDSKKIKSTVGHSTLNFNTVNQNKTSAVSLTAQVNKLFDTAEKVAIADVIPSASICRLPRDMVGLGKMGSIIWHQENFGLAKPIWDEKREVSYYSFNESHEVGRKSIGIIGTNCAILNFLLENKEMLVINKIESLPSIYIGIGKFTPSETFKGLFPINDFIQQLADNLKDILASGFSTAGEFSEFGEAQNNMLKVVNNESITGDMNAKDMTKLCADLVSTGYDCYKATQFEKQIKENMNKILYKSGVRKCFQKQILVISYLNDNDLLANEMQFVGQYEVSFQDILKKAIQFGNR